MAGAIATHTTSVRVGSSFALPAVIRSLGHSPELVFAEAGVDPALYTHPENRIAVLDLGRLFACAARITSRPDIALRSAERIDDILREDRKRHPDRPADGEA